MPAVSNGQLLIGARAQFSVFVEKGLVRVDVFEADEKLTAFFTHGVGRIGAEIDDHLVDLGGSARVMDWLCSRMRMEIVDGSEARIRFTASLTMRSS